MNTSAGAKKGAATKKLRYGADYYVKLGKKSTFRPFRDIPGLAAEAGRKSHEKRLDTVQPAEYNRES